MKLKDLISMAIFLIIIYMAFISENHLFTIIGISVLFIYFMYTLISSTLKWNKNKKEIDNEYIKLNIDNYLLEFAMVLNTCLKIKREYKYRDFYLEYFHNKKVEINNFNDFINTYDVIVKVLIYIIFAFSIGFIISIIKKIVCRDRISSKKILFSDGKLINLTEIKDIKIEDSFFGLSKKISLTLNNDLRIVYIKNDKFPKVKEYLNSLGTNNL